MAKRIKVGAPVNDAESWGFDLLERELPADWLLITNVEEVLCPKYQSVMKSMRRQAGCAQ